jgi:hypothetical protein
LARVSEVAGTDGGREIARAFVELQRILDRIRRGELEATPGEEHRLAMALDALRELRAAA